MSYQAMRVRVENARYRRSLRGRYDAALAETVPGSEEEAAVEADWDGYWESRLDEQREGVDEDDERGGRR